MNNTTQKMQKVLMVLKAQKRDKCETGYLAYRKKCQLIKTVIALIVITIVLFIGIFAFGSKNNYCTVLAAVLTLPMAKIAVSYFVLVTHNSTDEEFASVVSEKANNCICSFDCVFSTKEKVMGIQAAVVNDSQICLYTDEKISDKATFKQSITDFLKKDHLTVNVSLYSDKSQFLKRIQTISSSFESDNSKNKEKMNRVNNTMRIMCL